MKCIFRPTRTGPFRQTADGSLGEFPRTEDFKVVIAEHDDPDELAIERYNLLVKTGTIRVFGEPA
jgi:hypothetical protein